MRYWFRGKTGGLLAFLVISALVVGGLGWATAAALRLEQEQLEARLQAERQNNIRLALWRLDSLIAPALAKEESRPYNHYRAVFAPPLALQADGSPAKPGTVLEPSPLLNAELPDWMLLHFQVDRDTGWRSPQVLSRDLVERLRRLKIELPLTNVNPEREKLLGELGRSFKPDALVALAGDPGARPPLMDVTMDVGNITANSLQPQMPQGQGGHAGQQLSQGLDKEYVLRSNRQTEQQRPQTKSQKDDWDIVLQNLSGNSVNWSNPDKGKAGRGEQVIVTLGPMVPVWLPGEEQAQRLLLVRHVQIGKLETCQGIVLDWPRLQSLLAAEAQKENLFPQARVLPVGEGVATESERTMTVLPLQLDPGPVVAETPSLGWTPLRGGLVLAWTASLVALFAVGLGGWSLLDLSERRIRFVSAVTHELRTPLTTLRLYLDMLAGGMVKDSKQKEEYLQTLNTEADRLNRLVGNVLDFSRLENQRPRLAKTEVRLSDLLEQVHSTWQGRCRSVDKELVLENGVGDLQLNTDVQMVQQILGNLIDNACKYSRGAEDRHIWLRARSAGGKRVQFEVEDRGPGVPQRERRSIFRAFRRGRSAEVTGGVGLGLALAQRWARLLGGKIKLCPPESGAGACFCLELPVALG